MSRAQQRLVALALAGGLALNYPLLSLFDRPALILGVPALWLYLLSVWAVLIALAAVALERTRRAKPPVSGNGT